MADTSLAPTHGRVQSVSKPQKFTSWLFKSIGSWRTLLGGVLVVVLTAVSIAFNLKLAESMSIDDDSRTLLMTGFGALDLACIFLAGFIGVKSRSPFRKAVAWTLFAYLLALSLWASLAYAISIDSVKNGTAINNAIESKRAELATQAKSVELWQRNLAGTALYKTRYGCILQVRAARRHDTG